MFVGHAFGQFHLCIPTILRRLVPRSMINWVVSVLQMHRDKLGRQSLVLRRCEPNSFKLELAFLSSGPPILPRAPGPCPVLSASS